MCKFVHDGQIDWISPSCGCARRLTAYLPSVFPTYEPGLIDHGLLDDVRID